MHDAADTAQAHIFFSHLDTNIQRLLAGFGTLRDLVSDVRASLTDRLAADVVDRRVHEQGWRQWDRWWNSALVGFALLVPFTAVPW